MKENTEALDEINKGYDMKHILMHGLLYIISSNDIQTGFNYNDKFKKYIGDDLNTANAITLIYDVLKSNLNGATKLKLIDSFDKVYGDRKHQCNNPILDKLPI